MTAPLVTVVMPLYNKCRYVRRAIDSVLGQSFPDWELVVIDDGSTDGSTREVPTDELRIRLVAQGNAGPAAARNRGIHLAQGEYVTFLDADDYYYPRKLEDEMRMLHDERRADWMISAFDLESNELVRPCHIRDADGGDIAVAPVVVSNAIRQLTIAFWHVNGLCATARLLRHIGGFQERMRWLEITEMQIRCALAQPTILVSPTPSHRVVDVPGSASKISQHRIRGLRQMGEQLYALASDYPVFADILMHKSKESLLSYASIAIRCGEKAEARRFLRSEFPHRRDRQWWKLWAGSWLPDWLIDRLVSTTASRRDA